MRTLLFLTVAACGPKPAPPANVPQLDPQKVTITAGEPFAIAAVVWDVDVFEKVGEIKLPSDAKLDLGTATHDFATVGSERLTYSEHTLSVVLNDDFERFESEIAPKITAAVTLPPSTALVWAREETAADGPIYHAVAIETPPLLTTRDVATADDIPWPKMTISLDNDNKSKTEDIHAVKLGLAEDAAARYAAWRGAHAGHPLAMIVFGRVAQRTNVAAREAKAPPPKAEDVASFVVELDGVLPHDTRTIANALAKEVAERRKHRSH